MATKHRSGKLNNGKSLSMRKKWQNRVNLRSTTSPTPLGNYRSLTSVIVALFFFFLLLPRCNPSNNTPTDSWVKFGAEKTQNKHKKKHSSVRRKREEESKKIFIVAHFCVLFSSVWRLDTTNENYLETLETLLRRRFWSSMKPGSVWKSIKLLNLKDIGECPRSICNIHTQDERSYRERILNPLSRNYVIFRFSYSLRCNKQPFSLEAFNGVDEGRRWHKAEENKEEKMSKCSQMKNYQQMLAHFTYPKVSLSRSGGEIVCRQ